ncbi:MAG: PP2C family protein-serine/threonine phosphatase [Candidatus Dormibacteria bacterium]
MPRAAEEGQPRLSRRLRAGVAELRLHGQDRFLRETALGLFGVFDGVGQFSGSGEAAETAASLVLEACRSAGEVGPEPLVSGCQRAHAAIIAADTGATTATTVWIDRDRAAYASVGDSRLYQQTAGLALPRQVTVDEGEGRFLDNALGVGGVGASSPVARQSGWLTIAAGDKLVLVTDGITGDYPPDLLSPGELGEAIAGDDPELAAKRLVEIARKHDDRTAVVVFLD